MPSKKTNEEFIKEMSIKFPYYRILSNYNGYRKDILVKDVRCGHEFLTTPAKIYRGNYCPFCDVVKQKSEKKYNDAVKMLHGESLRILTAYNGTRASVEVLCNVCGHQWTTRADVLLKSGCPSCALSARTKTHEEFVYDCSLKKPNTTIKSQYINSRTNVDCECAVCGYQWSTLPTNLTAHTHGCPNCSGVVKRTHEEFVKEVSLISPSIEFTTEYSGVDNYIGCRCILCGHEWNARAGHIRDGLGCPNCRKSKGEERIESYLSSQDIDYVAQMRYPELHGIGGKRLSFDFYLPTQNLLIEFQGKQHETAIDYFGGEDRFKIQQENDNRKKVYARDNNIELLEIWYYDFDNIETILHNKLVE